MNPLDPHILVVDDDRDSRELWAFALMYAAFRVTSAEDGDAALAAASIVHPDLVITDVAMPRMDGVQLTNELRRHAWMRDVPILGVTGQGDHARARLLAAGASHVMQKPCCPDELVAIVREYLHRRSA
ncbi:MAG TPA: response regulator [Vicinamibacterales bacterium]|nr:response regulator [Vicinamibacterales bacterium]